MASQDGSSQAPRHSGEGTLDVRLKMAVWAENEADKALYEDSQDSDGRKLWHLGTYLRMFEPVREILMANIYRIRDSFRRRWAVMWAWFLGFYGTNPIGLLQAYPEHLRSAFTADVEGAHHQPTLPNLSSTPLTALNLEILQNRMRLGMDFDGTTHLRIPPRALIPTSSSGLGPGPDISQEPAVTPEEMASFRARFSRYRWLDDDTAQMAVARLKRDAMAKKSAQSTKVKSKPDAPSPPKPVGALHPSHPVRSYADMLQVHRATRLETQGQPAPAPSPHPANTPTQRPGEGNASSDQHHTLAFGAPALLPSQNHAYVPQNHVYVPQDYSWTPTDPQYAPRAMPSESAEPRINAAPGNPPKEPSMNNQLQRQYSPPN